jgi:hypothetical protein
MALTRIGLIGTFTLASLKRIEVHDGQALAFELDLINEVTDDQTQLFEGFNQFTLGAPHPISSADHGARLFPAWLWAGRRPDDR